MNAETFQLFATIVQRRSGLVLAQDKAYLLESRLMSVARKWNLKDLEMLAQAVRADRDEQLLKDITEAMMTSESSFFRDQRPFHALEQMVLPGIMKARGGRHILRIWSAASASGQEAYSIAMMMAENPAKFKDWKVEIFGTDISVEMVERAKSGLFSQFEVQRGLPVGLLLKYFKRQNGSWQISDQIRDMVHFQELNLIGDFGPVGTFDVVFCRNVLMYFDAPTKATVLERISQVLAPDGVLFLGGSETVMGVTPHFKMTEPPRGYYILDASVKSRRAAK